MVPSISKPINLIVTHEGSSFISIFLPKEYTSISIKVSIHKNHSFPHVFPHSLLSHGIIRIFQLFFKSYGADRIILVVWKYDGPEYDWPPIKWEGSVS